jgi:hypothetical protein
MKTNRLVFDGALVLGVEPGEMLRVAVEHEEPAGVQALERLDCADRSLMGTGGVDDPVSPATAAPTLNRPEYRVRVCVG